MGQKKCQDEGVGVGARMGVGVGVGGGEGEAISAPPHSMMDIKPARAGVQERSMTLPFKYA